MRMQGYYRSLTLLCVAAFVAATLLLPAGAAAAAPRITLHTWVPDTAMPGDQLKFRAVVENSGDAPFSGDVGFSVEFPAGIAPALPAFEVSGGPCALDAQTVTCAIPMDGTVSGSQFQPKFLAQVTADAEGILPIRMTASGGGAEESKTSEDRIRVGPPNPPSIRAFRAQVEDAGGAPDLQAGATPGSVSNDFRMSFSTLPLAGGVLFELGPSESPRNIVAHVPPGLLADPLSVPRCSISGLNTANPEPLDPNDPDAGGTLGVLTVPDCHADSQVGVVYYNGVSDSETLFAASMTSPLYNVEPPPGVPALFGFKYNGIVITLSARLRPGDHGFDLITRNVSTTVPFLGAKVGLWGAPADASHDGLRHRCLAQANGNDSFFNVLCPTEGERKAFLRLPTSCDGPLAWGIEADSYSHPGAFVGTGTTSPGLDGCGAVPFEPSLQVRPTTNLADSPSGLEVDLHLPQNDEADALAQSHLRDAVVKLPAGMTVNPAAADGLSSCTPDQIGLVTAVGEVPARLDGAEARCPDSSKVGTVLVDTPAIDHPLPGEVYLAAQQANPFGSLLAMYIAIDDPQSGIRIKLPVRITGDAAGQLTATVTHNPQLPFEDLEMRLFEGPRAALRTPGTCGIHTTTAELTPWARPGEAEQLSSSFQLTSGPGGTPCPNGGFDPKLSAGTQNPLAATHSPFSLRLTRADGTRELTGVNATLPQGLLAKLAGVRYCPEAALGAVSGALGTGAAQIATPSCPAASQVGTVTVGAGAGPQPFYTASGKAYLAGPYKGAPLSLAVVTPAVAGPFDLGSVVVRNALHVDPATAKVTAASDPFPTILHGIPLDLRDVRVELNKPQFTLNPTSCDPMAIDATIAGTGGASAQRSERFQVAGCDRLAFKPKLSLKLKGKTKRTGHPALSATLRMPPGGANIAKASVAMPRSLFLAQSHIRTICTRVQFAADTCPKGSVYGHAKAWSPLLDQPLEGPVYLRSSSNKLPDLVASLKGQIEVDLAGRIDSKGGGIRSTFDLIPDAPVTKFVLSMQGGKKSLLENSRDLCEAGAGRATALFDGHNGEMKDLRPKLKVRCGEGRGSGRK